MKYQQVYVIGDIGAQRAVFEESLRRIGLDPEEPHLPAGSALIQLGDVGRIPFGSLDSSGSIALAERLMSYNPHSYYQLVGNHDWAMIDPRAQWASHWKEEESVLSETMQRWWAQRKVHLALTLKAAEAKPALVTHAGLTAGQWRGINHLFEQWHMAQPSVREIATHLNAYVGGRLPLFLHPGELVTKEVSYSADVLWATEQELLGSWLEEGAMPFDQIHGHESPFDWRSKRWVVSPETQRLTKTMPKQRWAVTALPRVGGGEASLLSLDWQLGNEPRSSGFGIYSLQDAEITC